MTSRNIKSDEFLNSDTVSDEFFLAIVENKLKIKKDEFKVRHVLLSPATGMNENFMSVVYRAKIMIEMLATKERKSVNVIIKALITMSTMEELKQFSVFSRERFVYEDLLPSFKKIWLERANENVEFGPSGIKFESEPYEIIVLDDLKAEGFQMLDRKVGLNMQQTKILLSKLAKFHAASAIRHEKDGFITKQLDRKVALPDFPVDSPMLLGHARMFKVFAESIIAFEGCRPFGEKILRWNGQGFMREYSNVGRPMVNCGFEILCHGDLWLNNMMFKLDDEGNTVDVKLIDFQAPYWRSPAGDLLNFLLSSVADDIKIVHFDDFITFYQENLSEALKDLKCSKYIPTVEDLHADLLDKGSFGCTMLFLLVCFVKYNFSLEVDIQELLTGPENPEVLKMLFTNDNFRNAMQLWLPFLDERGFLDTMIKK